MPHRNFLCSELIQVSTSSLVQIGNLEQICADRCTVLMATPPPVGAIVRMRCLQCPRGRKSCTECRFTGRVRACENDPHLGCFIQVDFHGRAWSAEKWQPGHLTELWHANS